ncbi:hypothetical protein L596_007453 [Steinernema carpocapsae]|uniref:Uncharacterized protein n=1 Tax=Steinernema carpocapsae TaxID=34508 RepID=A0A4U5P9H1_STECR|nr:hypothetical protein L596_007453 [Steinernema carpocapsae]
MTVSSQEGTPTIPTGEPRRPFRSRNQDTAHYLRGSEQGERLPGHLVTGSARELCAASPQLRHPAAQQRRHLHLALCLQWKEDRKFDVHEMICEYKNKYCNFKSGPLLIRFDVCDISSEQC